MVYFKSFCSSSDFTNLDLRLQIKYEIEFFTNRLQHSIIFILQWAVQALLMVLLMAVQWFGTK